MERALVSLTFDDGLRCQFEQAVPILDRYGFPATFFLVANTDPIHTDGYSHPDWSKTDWSEKDIQSFKGMIQRGHEIGAHSVHHRHPYLDNDPRLEAEGSKQWIQDRLGVEVPSYCYPFCHITEPIKNAVINAGYKQARWGARNSYIPRGFSDWFKIDCHQISNSEEVDRWARPGYWYILMLHGIGSEQDGWEPITVVEFARQMAELAKLRDSGVAEVLTFRDSADRLRQSS
ncbi:MAG TPA: polysaccharide deacetylase family protein [Candidatus Acidoferrales bacterium]|nr:polysaccharide deacetylase family protein [Candidatus Acidoferrales bacterium]